jgi:hypothetical protein
MHESNRRAPEKTKDGLARLRKVLQQRQEEVTNNYEEVRRQLEV